MATIQNETSIESSNSSIKHIDNAVYITAPMVLRNICFAVAAMGIVLNIFTVVVIRLYKPMHKQLTNTFITNQSCIDATTAVFLLFTNIFQNDRIIRTPGNLHDELLCRLWFTQVPMFAMLVSSNYGIVALTLERYLAVVHPIWHKTKFTRQKVAAIIAAVWIFGPVWYFSFGVGVSKINESGECTIFVAYPNKATEKFAAILGFVCIYLTPLGILSVFYVRMARVLRSKVAVEPVSNKSQAVAEQVVVPQEERLKQDDNNGVKPVEANNPSAMPNEMSKPGKSSAEKAPSKAAAPKESASTVKARHNIMKTLALVAAGFVMCWTWSQLYFLMFHLGYDNVDFNGSFFNFTLAINFFSCCINPVIYCIQYRQFQKGVKWVFCRNVRGFTSGTQALRGEQSQRKTAVSTI